MNSNQTTITFILKQLLLDGNVEQAENKIKRHTAKEIADRQKCTYCTNPVETLCYSHQLASNHVNRTWDNV